MGYEDRQYMRDESPFGSRGFSTGQWTIITTLIVINFAIFFIDAFSPKASGGFRWLGELMALKTDSPWFIWNWLTYGFAHASIDSETGIWHIGGNMLALFFLGRGVESRLGRNEFLKFYLIAIVVSGLAYLLYAVATGSRGSVVGASGAVSAVVILFVCMYPKEKVMLIFPPIPMPAWILGVFLVLMDLSRAFDPNSPIAWQSHLAGAAFGASYFYFKWNFDRIDLSWIPNPFSGKPRLKVHNPNAKTERLKVDADRILAKIAEHGEESLTSRERKTLNKYSSQLRKDRD